MKSKFPGYFKLSESEIKKMWGKALFTFDANILLNLYRYSDETKEEFFKILDKIKSRIWIPYQSAQEFFNNRLKVINQQEKAYEEAISSLNTIENGFKNSRQHPFIKNELLDQFSKLSKEICDQLASSKSFHIKRILEDDILNKIESLFSNKVGEEFSEEKLIELYKTGEKRFLKKIPPGYKDSNKKEESEYNIRKYGDFVVWKQILLKSKDLKQGVILVTDDRKEDWWVRFNGKTISPRPELIKEFQTETNQSFHMYQSDRFLEYARDYLNEEVNEKAIEEIRELRELDERVRISRLNKERKKLRESAMKERVSLDEEDYDEYEGEVFFVVEDMPKFNGNNSDAFLIHIQKNLRYPFEAQEKGIEGRVFVQFDVDKYGKVKNAKIVRGVHEALDNEALRVVSESPKWSPGLQRGKPVAVRFTFPIVFQLG